MKAIVICSGGLDSVTLAYKMAHEHDLKGLISFDYGQRHKKETAYAQLCADRLDVPHKTVDITTIGALLTGSALTDNVDVPDGHYAEESMKTTVVPNRNAIMLTIAFGAAAAQECDCVATAVHGGDHFIYPDCRPDFIDSFNKMQAHALDGYANVALYAPFVHIPKDEIVSVGTKLNVPYADTWSCYKGGDIHCGRCGTCVERREAFHLAGVEDPTEYADPDFWIKARNDYKEQQGK
ncbi:7-cyano-7-deazaguanine synthase QueC [Terasakiella sp. A23]|uniref:7-cyano-7-deazaguanine synthase QueC n=1 Tax=Terasakiella sp. FCG-A23 TaxID=3080561 RepID=UPI0029540172|nr:7-cyano-7-deazaguanine synthase QueC [Terasakiella sp. A23]MDV7338342.1 7-cyano-7-deazaguanine synthase QueC [Terasakiella sp. A23]